MKPTDKSRLIIPAAIFVGYVALRYWRLTDSCLWFDEIFSVHAAMHGWYGLFRFAAQDLIHPPLFYVLLKLWIAVGGESLFWLRSLPVLFSLLAYLPFYLLCRQFKLRPSTTAMALTLIAVNGSLIKYAQEVRMYSLLMCLSLFSLWLFARYLNVGKGIWFLTLVNVLLVHTHYFGWTIVAGEILTVAILQRIKIGQTLIMLGITTVSASPWIIAAASAAQGTAEVSQNLGWAARPGLITIVQFAFGLFEPFYFRASSLDKMTVWYISLPLLTLIVAAFALYLFRRKKHGEREKNSFIFLAVMIFMPAVTAFAASWALPFSVWGTRHLIVIFGPAAILAAKALGDIRHRRARTFAASAVIVFCASAFLIEQNRGPQTYIWCAWEDLSAKITAESLSEPSQIVVFDDLIAYHFWFALRNNKNLRILKVNGVPGMTEDTAYFLPRGFGEVQTVSASDLPEDKFYVAFYAPDFNYLKPPLRFLIEKGYHISDPQIVSAQGLQGFLVEVKRKRDF